MVAVQTLFERHRVAEANIKNAVIMRKRQGGVDMLGSDTRNYAGINNTKIAMMISDLIEGGAIITGNNPWNVDTRRHGVMLKAEWNETASTLVVSIAHSGWFVSRRRIWSILDELISHIQRIETI